MYTDNRRCDACRRFLIARQTDPFAKKSEFEQLSRGSCLLWLPIYVFFRIHRQYFAVCRFIHDPARVAVCSTVPASGRRCDHAVQSAGQSADVCVS